MSDQEQLYGEDSNSGLSMVENDWMLSRLQNPLLCPDILDEIFKYMDPGTKSIKQFRLVCKIWNTTILSMSLPKICLIVNTTKEIKINGKRLKQDPNEFKNLCDTMNPKLARRISSFIGGVGGVSNIIDPIRFQNFQLCAETLGEYVQFISIKEIHIKLIPELYNILQKYCPRVKVLEVLVIDKFGDILNNDVAMLPYTNNNNLESLDIRWRNLWTSSGPVKTMLQLLLDAASNLKKITLTFDFFPNLSNNAKLETLIINGGNVGTLASPPAPIPAVLLTELSTMLQQVSSHLTQLELRLMMFVDPERNFVFTIPKMPKLKSFSANDIRGFSCGKALEKVIGPSLKSLAIVSANPPGQVNNSSHVKGLIDNMVCYYGGCQQSPAVSLASLTLQGDMGDIRILRELRAPFPGLRRLNFFSSNTAWSMVMEPETSPLYTALGVCSYLDLEHSEITFKPHHMTLSHIIKCLSDHTDLFRDKRIRTLIINGLSTDLYGAKRNNQMNEFEQVLMSTLGMDRFSLLLTTGPPVAKWRQRLDKFIEDNKLPVQYSQL